MGQYFQALAKDAGFADEDIASYLDQPELPTSLFVPKPKSDNLPDIVDPFKSPETTSVSQSMGQRTRYNPQGHVGLDLTNTDRSVTNPIGGINISGYQRGGYGNYNAVVGASPEELAQMDPKQIELIRQAVKDKIAGGAESLNSINIPGKNIEIQGHLAAPAPDMPTVATGSANLKMGSTGRSTGPHLHQEFKDTKGQQQDIRNILKNIIYK